MPFPTDTVLYTWDETWCLAGCNTLTDLHNLGVCPRCDVRHQPVGEAWALALFEGDSDVSARHLEVKSVL